MFARWQRSALWHRVGERIVKILMLRDLHTRQEILHMQAGGVAARLPRSGRSSMISSLESPLYAWKPWSLIAAQPSLP